MKQSGRTFLVTITETLKLTVEVSEAMLDDPTVEAAEQYVNDRWHNAEYILDADNFVGVEFEGQEVTFQ